VKKDPDDNKILECAQEVQADLIITIFSIPDTKLVYKDRGELLPL